MNYKVEDLIYAVKIESNIRKQEADLSGESGDRGSSVLLEQVKWYEMGRNNDYPKEWEIYTKHIDKEYKEYLRLKRKFNIG